VHQSPADGDLHDSGATFAHLSLPMLDAGK